MKNNTVKYPEITPQAILVGVTIGLLMTASFSYAALVLGFSTNGSPVAAVLGWGIMRTIFKRGTIVENNIVQTVASGINTATSGVIFTLPVLLIRGIEFNVWWVGAAAVAGAILGVGFIIPLRKQMLDIDRLRFPSGTAVASILKSPAEGIKKSRLLIYGALISASIYLLTQFPRMGLPEILPGTIDLGAFLNLPDYIDNIWAVSLLSLGIGFISGRNGLFVLAGGVLAYWLITPFVISLGWIPADIKGTGMTSFIHDQMTRPLGIGMLIGGSLMSIIFTLPALKSTVKSFNIKSFGSAGSDELPIKILYIVISAAFVLFFLAAWLTSSISFFTALIVSIVGTLWLFFAGIIISQATGMTDWTPISGMSLLAVAILMLFLPSDQLVTAVLIGAAVAVAIAECADMMQDLKTGYLVGSIPAKQQTMQLIIAGIGPIVSISVMLLIWNSGAIDPVSGVQQPGFGPGTDVQAPQAIALGATIDSIVEGNVPGDKFLTGGILGALLSFSGIPGLGVIMGIAMYLSIKHILPYGLGSILNLIIVRKKGKDWSEKWGVPFAAGLIVGEALLIIVFAFLTVSGVLN
ncbi:MAG: OPT/YSL family transporter [Melioribacteraceae bacterium]|nr:OPT/YSL family transporter [Melioribacteraceae bacterium]MCF8354083.1 OPT/YSL family transporter [Melioribacteraceae bacterium]MCF8393755.1 OPT/YSL family transporter [Melioribacteraceae bacterium]MCF8419499.1 OPT/YSL family transporter [Melioribacteraceae bacterium]